MGRTFNLQHVCLYTIFLADAARTSFHNVEKPYQPYLLNFAAAMICLGLSSGIAIATLSFLPVLRIHLGIYDSARFVIVRIPFVRVATCSHTWARNVVVLLYVVNDRK